MAVSGLWVRTDGNRGNGDLAGTIGCSSLIRPETGRSPVDRTRTGLEHHVITEGAGVR